MAPLPIIDISPYLPPSDPPSSDSHPHLSLSSTSESETINLASLRAPVAAALHSACKDVGFFYLSIPEWILPQSQRDAVLRAGHEFFELPQEDKEMLSVLNSDRARGYQRLHVNVTQGKEDHQEGFDLYAPNPYAHHLSTSSTNPTYGDNGHADSTDYVNGHTLAVNGHREVDHLRTLEGPNQWPLAPSSFKPTIEAWIEKMKVLGLAVTRAMADGLGMNEGEWEELKGIVEDSFWAMRVIGYPPFPEGMDGYSCGEDKDYGCLTLLHADPINSALQVLHNGDWIDADPLPGCFVVNIGSMWGRLTAGYTQLPFIVYLIGLPYTEFRSRSSSSPGFGRI